MQVCKCKSENYFATYLWENINISYKTINTSVYVQKKSSPAYNSCLSLFKSRKNFHSQEIFVMMLSMTLKVSNITRLKSHKMGMKFFC